MAWLTDPAKWADLGRKLVSIGEFGVDTETYGQPEKTSPAYRAKVHCWSIGVLTSTAHPRGYRTAVGVVLPFEALLCPELQEALSNPSVVKWAHNSPHDYHSLSNCGVLVRNMQDTLQWARVAVPGMRDYGLKDMEVWALGKKERPSFIDVVSYPSTQQRSTFRKEKFCKCGEKPCRARATSQWWDTGAGYWEYHDRLERTIETVHMKDVVLRYDVTQFVPGAELLPLEWRGQTVDRMTAWEAYSLADAVSGIELVDWLRRRPVRTINYPWG